MRFLPRFLTGLRARLVVAFFIVTVISLALIVATLPRLLDGYFEQQLGTWDVAAGGVIVREAGGVVTDWQGDDRAWLTSGDVVAGPPAIHARILELIADE